LVANTLNSLSEKPQPPTVARLATGGRSGAKDMQMTLMEYITQHFNGDLLRYAQSEGVSREQIISWIDNECHVIKGRLFMPVKHLPVEQVQ
jgi:hypothetical protein